MRKCNPVKTCSCRYCKGNPKRREKLHRANRRFRKTGKNIQEEKEIPVISAGYIA